MRMVQTLSKFVDRELHHRNFLQNQIVQSTPVITLISGIPEGEDELERQGIQVTFRSMKFRQVMFRGNTDAFMRTTIVVDKQSNGALPGVGDLYENNGSSSQQMVSPFDNNFAKRFTIFYDRTRTFTANAASAQQVVRFGRKLSHRGRWLTGGNTIADVASGAIVMFQIGTQAAVNASPTVETSIKLRFAP